MKKYRSFLYIGTALLLLFIIVSTFTFQKSKSLIQEGYLKSEGSAAENFAVLTAANIQLTDEQVETLKNYSYDELMNSQENSELKNMMDNHEFLNKVDYAYIMIHLKDSEVKYSVTEEIQHRFNAPIGTKLDIMWLLDVNISEELSASQENAEYDELNRYSYYIDEDAQIFGETPSYIYNASEWGNHICGYAPIYTTSGKYVGVLGVELQTGDYDSYCNKAVFAMGALVVVSMIMLSVLFVFIYLNNRKMQYDRIYIDSLTQVYNRSYYNNQFIKKMNRHHFGATFAMMIADVDYFKKVNDTFGHDIGDEVLSELAEILVGVFGKEYVIRLGGEEFVIGMWVDDEKKLSVLIDKLFEKVRSNEFTSRHITLTVSLGCCYSKTDRLNGWLTSGMLRAADCRLYDAKENGRDRYYIEEFDSQKVYKKASDADSEKTEEKPQRLV